MDTSVSPLNWERVKEGAEHFGISPNTFQQWKSRGKVPYRWHLPLIEFGIPAEAFRQPAE
jgi:hypothetical protein